MDKIKKLLKKISKKDRERLIKIIKKIIKRSTDVNSVKIKNTNFYRVRSGRFRIIFHYKKDNKPEIDSIKLKDENTYK